VSALVGVPVLGLLTLYLSERWAVVWHDVAVFFSLGSRAKLKERLVEEGSVLADAVEGLAGEYRPRLDAPAAPVDVVAGR
jgi:glycerol-3-phosphate O-acyltransferase / dihydroxyacetone phosphate acyltransferase